MMEPDAALWGAIGAIGGDRAERKNVRSLTLSNARKLSR